MPLSGSFSIQADLIVANMAATSKKQAFQDIAERTALLFQGDAAALLTALLERERIGSTGIGAGVAIPHVKLAGVTRPYGVLVRLNTAVDYDAIDGLPVDIIFMLLVPAESKTTQHLKVLAQMSRFLKDARICTAIRATTDESIVAAVLAAWIKAQETALAS